MPPSHIQDSCPQPYAGDPSSDQERDVQTAPPVREGEKQGILKGLIVCLLLLIGVAGAVLITVASPVRTSVTVEAGAPLDLELFVKRDSDSTAFQTDISAIDTAVPGRYYVKIDHRGRTYPVSLTVRDTVPPTGVGKTLMVPYGAALTAADCVENVQDATSVTIDWETPPDMELVGPAQTVVARLTDAGGNSLAVTAQVTIQYDVTAPVIEGAEDIEAFIGDSVTYREGVTVTDDVDPAPTLDIDASAVNMNAEGEYAVYYNAADASGNTASVAITLRLKVKPADYVDEAAVYEAAQETYDAIIDDDMTDMEKAFAIYRWVKNYIDYRDNSNYEYWTIAAYQAFTRLGGDCYNYYAAARALLNMAGIENLEVEKSDISHSRHYWLLIDLGYGWYHMDPTPRKGNMPDNTFMLTDQEMAQYSWDHGGSNVFDPDLYPERATESVQQWVDYEAGRIIQPEPHGDGQ